MPTIHQNIALPNSVTKQNGVQTSTVGEPSLATNGSSHILFTGNWYGAASTSSSPGASWSLRNPFTFFPSANGGFCCDQTVIYDPSRDLTFWILQYIKDANTNTLRVAVKRGSLDSGDGWYWWDFAPGNGEWYDYNHAALSNNFLYVGSNIFSVSADRFTRARVLKFPLDGLKSGGNLSYSFFETKDNFSLRCAQGATDTMYLASHNSNTQVRIFSWPEPSDLTIHDVDTNFWAGGNYSAVGPDGNNWLARTDPRITAGWVADGVIGFLWSANSKSQRPLPYVRGITVDESNFNRLSEPELWNPSFAFAYPDTYPSSSGAIGLSCYYGGGTINPGHVVGVGTNKGNSWSLAATRIGSNGPSGGNWGDYVTVRRHGSDSNSWVASGATLQGGTTNANIEPRFVRFSA